MEIRYDPDFGSWLESFLKDEELFDVYAELVALIDHLAGAGQEILEPESKPIASSRYLHELRRTPPSTAAPYADKPPVLRVLYAFCRTSSNEVIAVVLLGGDKTELGNAWYPTNLMRAETRLTSLCGTAKLIPIRN